MNRHVRLGYLLLASMVAVGCGGGPKSADIPIATRGKINVNKPVFISTIIPQNAITLSTIAKMGPIRKATFPSPVDLRIPGVAKIIKDSTPQLNQPPPYPLPPLGGYASLRLHGAKLGVLNTTGGVNDPQNDATRNHVNRGPVIPADVSYIGEQAINTAYTNVSVPANWTVYSPTIRPPGTLELTRFSGRTV